MNDVNSTSFDVASASYAVAKPRLRGWIHLGAVPLALLGTVVLVLEADHSTAGRVSALVFGLCLVGLYATSSLYHVPRWSQRMRRVLSRCDGAMIQFTIAGTFTPIAFHTLEGGWRSWSLAGAWGIAVIGAVLAASPLEAPRWLGTVGYIAVGWLTVVPFTKIMTALPWEGTGLIVLGGVLYTIGAIVYGRRWPDPFPRWFGYHEIFHLFVVAASTAHYLAIWRYVLALEQVPGLG
ncbi:MAG: PAQR family membrane homeostasis protein TrhA [Egibacteraceae bacterium]